jgi:hypothetical protein
MARIIMRLRSLIFACGVLCSSGLPAQMQAGQQIVERGALGKPQQVLDETGQWTTPLLLAQDHDVEIYMPDVTSPDWLKRNYSDFRDRGVYTLSLFTFYRTPEACRTNQTQWGLGDAEHLNACVLGIGYRVRRARVDPQQKSVTLLMAAMIGQDGVLDASSIQDDGVFRTWDRLDTNTQIALAKANALVTAQMKLYDEKMQSVR